MEVNTAEPTKQENRFFSRYIWLFYCGFFFIDPILSHSATKWLEFAIFFPIFLFLYLYPDDGRPFSELCVAGMFVLGLVYLPFNPSSSGTIIYVCAFMAWMSDNSKVVIALLVAAISIFCLDGYLLHVFVWSYLPVAALGLVVGVANLGQAKEHRAHQKLKRANEEIEHLAKVAERERIARDLHDLLGHTLSMITLKAELAGRLIATEPERAHQEIGDVEQTARRALTEVRQAVRGYRSEGVNAELERAGHTLATAGVRLTREGSLPASLSPAEETVVAMVLREAITNIVRHSRATLVKVSIRSLAGALVVNVSDNGRGGIVQEGSGIRGMRERMEALGGHFAWESSARAGTALHCEFPLAHPPEPTEAELRAISAPGAPDAVQAPAAGLLTGGGAF